MKHVIPLLFLVLLSCSVPENKTNTEVPEFLTGYFEDDYGITYSISDSIFMMEDHTKIHILNWNLDEQFFVGQNDTSNMYDPLLYSRIDWMQFEEMGEFKWGFCMSGYNEVSLDSAQSIQTVDRANPKNGCNGYPFSRMKRITN